MNYKIRTIHNFDQEIKRLVKKYPSLKMEIEILIKSLIDFPIQGSALGKDCYKIRLAIASKNVGKRGGARVITCIKIIREEVILLSIYDKAEQADISDKVLVELLKGNDLL